MTFFAVSLGLFLLVGLMCNHFSQRQKQSAQAINEQEIPVYDYILPNNNNQELPEMKANVAYCTVFRKPNNE